MQTTSIGTMRVYPIVQAEVDKPLKDVVHKAELSQLDKLFSPYGQEVYTRLLLTIQVNVFSCGGLAIRMMMSHVIADAFSMFMFLKTWASIANGKDPDTVLFRPYFDLWKLFPPPSPLRRDMDMPHDGQNPNLIPNEHVTKWFMFSEDKLNFIRSKLLAYINIINENNILCNYTIGPPSLPMVLTAFIWSRIIVACQSNVNMIPCEVLHAVNLRFAVSPPDINSYYFGNMYTLTIAKPSFRVNEDNNSCNEPLWCKYLQETEKSICKIISKDESFIRGIEEGKEDLSFIKEHYNRKSRGEIMSIDFSNLRSLPAYEADFGSGKPVWVAVGSQKFKDFVILINANPSTGDMFAYVCLSGKDMAKLESDAEFIASVSKAPCASCKL